MQRWIKLPDGRFIDANRIAYVGKVETFARTSEDGNDLDVGYMVNLGTDFPRDAQISVTGEKEEIFNLLKILLSGSATTKPDQ